MELRSSDSTSVKYHKIFDFKLTKDEIFKWQYKNEKVNTFGISSKKNKKRTERERYSEKKLKIAQNASKIISKVPTVIFVGITGSLAMSNSDRDSDIDLMIITRTNRLWTTRMLVYLLLTITGYKLRKPEQNNEKNKLCLNMWLDESKIVWSTKDRNIYTAHEIAQIIPLINKNNTYQKVLFKNKWILKYWPNAVVINNLKEKNENINLKESVLEKLAFLIQYWYMRSKITREIITPHEAIFHKNDWGKVVINKLTT